jgi:hypothetical protein
MKAGALTITTQILAGPALPPQTRFLSVDLGGTGSAPPSPAQITVTPNTLDFGNVSVGQQVTKSFNVSNSGGSDLLITGVENDLSGTDIMPFETVSPMLVGDTIYLGGPGPGGFAHALYAVNASTGANVWAAPVEAALSTGAADPDHGLLFVAMGQQPSPGQSVTAPSAVLALHLANGAPAWAAPVVLLAPAPAGLSVGQVRASSADVSTRAVASAPYLCPSRVSAASVSSEAATPRWSPDSRWSARLSS